MKRARCGIGLGAVALLVAACGSGSGSSVEEEPAGTSPPETIATADPEAQPEGSVAEAPDDAESSPSLPSNIWPEEIVETSEIEVEITDADDTANDDIAKDVVTRSSDAVGDGVLPEGVGSVTARVTSADGEVCEVCLWLADDDASRQRGLMDVTDLGNAVGMAFTWDVERTGNFFMFQTPTPLSIAWFDDQGAHVGQADMEPCLVENSATCERYTADSPYVVAVEMFGGQLDAIGIGPGSSIELLDLPCV